MTEQPQPSVSENDTQGSGSPMEVSGQFSRPTPTRVDSLTPGETYRVGCPYKRVTVTVYDNGASPDGRRIRSWAPGFETECDDYGCRDGYFCDAWGFEVRTLVSLHRPGKKYPERAFYTRVWVDPQGHQFGKPGLRVTTSEAFKRWANGRRNGDLLDEIECEPSTEVQALFALA